MRYKCWAIVLFLCLLAGCADGTASGGQTVHVTRTARDQYEITIFAMDTVMTLRAHGPKATDALREAARLLFDMDARFSAQGEGSEIAALNERAGEWHPVSDEARLQLEAARTLSERSGGLFDVSIYPLVRAWGFPNRQYNVPTPAEIAAAQALVDYRRIEVKDDAVRLEPGMAIDLGGIAKGYAGQKVTELLAAHGVTAAMISLGGNVQVLGHKPDGSDWRVAIQDPADADGYVGVLSVSDRAVVTAGGYQRYFEADGVIYHHILDPRTGYPAQTGLASVTVVCENGMEADGLSTTLFLLGLDGGLAYYEAYGGFEAVFVSEDGSVTVTSGLIDRYAPFQD